MSSSNQIDDQKACSRCGHALLEASRFCPQCGLSLVTDGRIAISESSGSEKPATDGRRLDDRIYEQILSNSSVKIGMCLTLLGLLKVVEGVKQITFFADELVGLTAAAFLCSTIVTYFALKETDQAKKRRKGRIGDLLFSAALCLLAVVCVVIALELI